MVFGFQNGNQPPTGTKKKLILPLRYALANEKPAEEEAKLSSFVIR